jgi:hypothetical protein
MAATWITTPFGRTIRRAVRLESSASERLAGLSFRSSAPKPAPNQSVHATTAPTRSWNTSSGEIWKPEDTGLQTTDPDKNGFVGRLRYIVRFDRQRFEAMGLNARQLEIMIWFVTQKRITNADVQELTGANRKAASRDLDDLVERADQTAWTGPWDAVHGQVRLNPPSHRGWKISCEIQTFVIWNSNTG